MRGVLFVETLRRTFWQTLYWGVGLGLMACISTWLVPLFDAIQLTEVMQNLPPFIRAAAGLDESMTALMTPEGIVTVSFFGKFALLFTAYPVVMGMRVTSSEEDDGILDVLLSLPIRRWQVILEKFAAYTLTIVVIGALVYGGLGIGAQLSGITLSMPLMAAAVLNLIPMLIMVLALTIFVGVFIHRRQTALAVITGVVLVSFLLNTFGSMVTGGIAAALNAVSFFSYFNVNALIQNGLNISHVTGLLGAAGLLLAGAVWRFQRRDVGL